MVIEILLIQAFYTLAKKGALSADGNFSVMCPHTTYSRKNMLQKCEGDCVLWVLNEII